MSEMQVIRKRVDSLESEVSVEGSFVTNDSYSFEQELGELVEKYRI